MVLSLWLRIFLKYYNIIQKEIAGQNVYFLLGWNANQMNSERKIIEPFGFNSKSQKYSHIQSNF